MSENHLGANQLIGVRAKSGEHGRRKRHAVLAADGAGIALDEHLHLRSQQGVGVQVSDRIYFIGEGFDHENDVREAEICRAQHRADAGRAVHGQNRVVLVGQVQERLSIASKAGAFEIEGRHLGLTRSESSQGAHASVAGPDLDQVRAADVGDGHVNTREGGSRVVGNQVSRVIKQEAYRRLVIHVEFSRGGNADDDLGASLAVSDQNCRRQAKPTEQTAGECRPPLSCPRVRRRIVARRIWSQNFLLPHFTARYLISHVSTQ